MLDKEKIFDVCEKTEHHWPKVTVIAGLAIILAVIYTALTSGV